MAAQICVAFPTGCAAAGKAVVDGIVWVGIRVLVGVGIVAAVDAVDEAADDFTDEEADAPAACCEMPDPDDPDYCNKMRAYCIAECTAATLPTYTYDGAPFHRCLAECMAEAGC